MLRTATLTTLIVSLALLWPKAGQAYCVHRDTGAVTVPPFDKLVEDCCSGRPSRWRAQDLPVPVYIWDQTDEDFDDAIEAAIDTWNAIPSSTFRMTFMGRTSTRNAPSGTVIIGFDPDLCSDDPNCDPDRPPIAGTGCPTTGDGTASFHIDRCTIIANGENIDWGTGPTKPDAQWVITHELGHVLGIMHPGAVPRNPGSHGCGAEFKGATMACCGGQQDAGTLELDDVAAATALYPRWAYTVEVVNPSGMPIEGAAVTLKGTCFPHDGGDYNEGGMVFGDIPACLIGEDEASDTYHPELTYVTGGNGRTGAFRVLHDEFCLSVAKPGFKTADGCQFLPAAGNYITTVTLQLDIEIDDCSSALPGSPRASALVLLGLAGLSARRRRR